MKLSNARATETPGHYDITVTLAADDPWVMTTPFGPVADQPFDYTVAPDDPAPLAAAIREMVEEQAIEIGPYVAPPPVVPDPNAPPTLEERLAALEEKAARADKLEAILIQKGAVSMEAIDAVAIEAPALDVKA